MVKAPWTRKPEVQQAMDFFQRNGWTSQQAAGIVANLERESQLHKAEPGDKDKSGIYQAYGIAQWHPDRQQAFQDWMGKPIKTASLQDQLGFVQHELTDGAFKSTGDALQTAQTPSQASTLVMKNYERPKDHTIDGPNDMARMLMAEDLHKAMDPSGQSWVQPQPQQVQPGPPTPTLSPSIYAVPQVST